MEINKKGYLNNVFILMIGTVAAQLIPVALQPILRRQYTPEFFGEFAIFSAVVEIIVTIASLRYEQAILVPKNRLESKDLFRLSIYISLILNFIVFILVLLALIFEINFLKIEGVSSFSFILIPFASLFFSIINTGSYWYTRQGRFKGLSINKLYRRFFEGGVQISAGFFSNPLGLVIGMFSGLLMGTIHFFYSTKLLKSLFKDMNFNHFKNLFLKYKSFVIYGVGPSLLNILSIFIPVFIISSKFSANLTGQFDLSRQILALPLVIISGSLSQVLIKKVMTKFHNEENFMKDLKFTFMIISCISILIVIGYFLVGKLIIVTVFGKEWIRAAELSEILILGYGMKFINTCFYNILIPLNKVKVLGWWQAINFLVYLLLLVPVFSQDIERFSISYVVIEVVSNLVCLVLVFKTSQKIIDGFERNKIIHA